MEPDMRPNWRPYPEQDCPYLAALVAHGHELLGLGQSPSPPRVAAEVERWLNDAQDAEHPMDSSVSIPVAIAWGDAIARQLQWEWGEYHWDSDTKEPALAPPDRAHMFLPLTYILDKLEPGATSTAMLLFNMLVAGQRPPARPGAFVVIG